MKLKLPNFLKFSDSTKRQIKVGFLAILISGVLHFTGSIHIVLAISLFSVFSLYLYIESMNKKIRAQDSKIEELSKLASMVQEMKEKGKYAEPVIPPAKESVKGAQIGNGQEEAMNKIQKNISDVVTMIEEVNQAALQNQKDITNLENSLVKFGHKVEEIAKIATTTPSHSRFSHLMEETTGIEASGHQIEHNDASLVSGKYRSFGKLEGKLALLQESFQVLSNVNSQDLDIQQMRDTVMKCIYLIQELVQRVDYLVDQTYDIKEFNYRISRLESGSLAGFNEGSNGQMIPLVKDSYDKIISLEEKMKVLSSSLQGTGELLNRRVDDLSYILNSAIGRASQKTTTI